MVRKRLPFLRGRGTVENPAGRFERHRVVPLGAGVSGDACGSRPGPAAAPPSGAEPWGAEPWGAPPSGAEPSGAEPDGSGAGASAAGEGRTARSAPSPSTRLLEDRSRSVLTTNRSPDVPFRASLNPYRGCEHGCIYCYARPTHEYLGLSAGLDFETRIFVKRDAPRLLRHELARPAWEPTALALSGVTDPYQPAERGLGVTRGCLEVLASCRHPVSLVTKSALVLRDLDLLRELARHDAVRVSISVTTLDEELRRILEPRAPTAERRLEAVRRLAEADVPVGVLVAPVVPGLTEREVPRILERAARAGATHAGSVLLRLPGAVEGLFTAWLERHLPERKEKVLGRIRDCRGGRLNDPRFGSRMRGEGPYARQIRDLFRLARRRAGIPERTPPLSTAAFRRPSVAAVPGRSTARAAASRRDAPPRNASRTGVPRTGAPGGDPTAVQTELWG